MEVKGYIMLNTTFSVGEKIKEIKARCLVIDASFYYNKIIGYPTFNQLAIALSTLYLCMKFHLLDMRVIIIQEY